MSVKRVFAIIGIVVGCITAFVGGVLGVMAIMGKFKTPEVRPEKIYFENPEQVVVAQYKDDNNNDVINYFILKGENSSYDVDVNIKDCLIWFENGVGEDLIILCDKNGNPLVADAKGRYSVNCNEKIYYKFNDGFDNSVELDPSYDKNGKVVLKAKTGDDLHAVDQPLVIWVDRTVNSIFLNYGTIPSATNDIEQTQQINIGKESELEFDYVINPTISLQPISKESAKVVELYYRDPNYEDYILVNVASIQNSNYNLKNIFDVEQTIEKGKLVLKSNTITNGNPHEFKLAIFPTYNARQEYFATLPEGGEPNSERIKHMCVTNLYIAVVNSNVDSVSMSNGSVNLHLYSQNDFIYLNNSNAENNNLNILMQNQGKNTDIRYGEIDFDKMTNFYGSPIFEIERAQANVLNEIDFSNYTIDSYDKANKTLRLKEKSSTETLTFAVDTSIVVGGYEIINKLTYGGNDYYCKNGIAFINEEEDVKLLNAGSYLNFYIYDSVNKTYTQTTDSNIKYSVEKIGSETNAKWKIIVEYFDSNILDDTKQLVLGLLVANNDGKFVVDNLFATKNVKVDIEDLTYTKLKSSQTLNYVINSTNEQEEYLFKTFFEVGGGSYNACVLCIAESDLEQSPVEYIENYYFKQGEVKYYIVGYLDENNKFVNSLKVKDNENITKTTEKSLYLLQLKNSYEQTAEQLITKLIKDSLDLSDYVQYLYKTELVKVSQNLYITENTEISTKIDNLDTKPTSLYEESAYTLTISSTTNGLITRLVKFYGIDINNIGKYISINYKQNVNITEVTITDDKLTLTFVVGNTILNNPTVTMNLIEVIENSGSIELYSFKIASSAPETIVYYYGENPDQKITLADPDSASIQTITAKIGWENNDYTTSWYIGKIILENGNITNTKLENGINLNSVLSENYSGFQDPEFKIGHNITYSIIGSGVEIKEVAGVKSLVVVGTDTSYLHVTIAGVTKCLKIEIDTTEFELTTKLTTITGTNGNLSDLIDYKYGDSSIYNANLITLAQFTYNHSSELEFVPSEGNITLQVKEENEDHSHDVILKIEKDNTNGWKFTRVTNGYSALSIGFKIITKTKSLDFTLTFERDVIHEYNSVAWENPLDKDKIYLYQGTTILLYEVSTNETTSNNEPLIKIRDKGSNTISVTAYESASPSSSLSISNGQLLLSNCGDYTVKISVSGTEIGNYNFTVIPNVVVKQTDESNILSSNYIGTIGFIKLYCYITTDNIYGKKVEGKTLLYSQEDCLTEITMGGGDNISFSSTGDMLTKDDGSANVKTGWIEKIGESKDVAVTVTVTDTVTDIVTGTVTSNVYKVGSFNAVVKNNYTVDVKDDSKIKNNVLNIKAMTNINDWLKVEGFTINNVNWKYSTADDNKRTNHTDTTIIPESNITYNNVTLLLTFTGTVNEEQQTLTFEGKISDLTINIVPYELDEVTEIKAYSNNNFNLLTDVYDKANITNYYQSITVNSVKDENGNSLTNSNLGNVDLDNGLIITFNNIVGDSITAYINYTVIYKNGTTYTYSKEITLFNYEELVVTYPEDTRTANKTSTDYAYDEPVTFKTFSGKTYSQKVEKYEPVLVNANDNKTIYLHNDTDKFVNRIIAKDRISNEEYKVNISSIELFAYQNSLNMNSYAEQVDINKDNGTITLPTFMREISGLLVFKITSTSGNICYYYINVHSTGTNTNVKASTTGYINCEIQSGNNSTLKDILKDDNTKFNKDPKSFNDLFKVDISNVDIYLLNATVLGDNNVEYQNTVLTKETAGATTSAEQNLRYTCVNDYILNITDYTTLTLSLIYNGEYDTVYPVGIVTIYARPTGAPSTTGEGQVLNAEFSNETENIFNGIYKCEIDANETEIAYPENCTVSKIYQGTNCIEDYEIKSSIDSGEKGIKYSSTPIDQDDTVKKIKLTNKVTTDYVFTVFYKKNDNSGLTIKVVYTYKAVEIPTANYQEVGNLVVGSDDSSTKFNNSVTFSGDTFTKYFGTYQGKITIGGVEFTIDNENKIKQKNNNTSGTITDTISYAISNDDLTLTFTQTTSQYTQNVEFVFTDAKVNGESVKITHTFNVLSGLEIIANTTDDSGTSSAQRKTSILTYDSESAVGSKISFTQATTGDGVKYTFGGYTIYINNASGSLTFNFNTDATNGYADSSYETTSKTNGELTINSTTSTFNFVHLAEEKEIDVTFTISNGTYNFKVSGNDVTRIFYIKLAKTYTEISPVYVTTSQTGEDGETYTPTAENVLKGSTIANLGSHLFTSSTGKDYLNATRTKVTLITGYENGKPTTAEIYANFSAMGFLDSKNPNFINFDLADGSKATLTRNDNNSQNITFPSIITKNESCVVYMSNSAGMPTTNYQFNIMADTQKDGITFSADGYVDEGKTYMSFVINPDDNNAQDYTTGELKIGSINDNLGVGVFVIDSSLDKGYKFLPKNGAEGESCNITDGSYNYDIIFKTDPSNATKYNIYLKYNRKANKPCLPEKTELELTIHGSTDFILNNFKIVLYNIDINPTFDGRDSSIYGGDKIDLRDKFFTKNAGGYNMPTDLDLEFELDEDNSKYGSTNPTMSLASNKDLISFKIEEGNPIIQTKTVGSLVKIDAVFHVKIGDVFIKDVTYKFQLNRSLQFSFNGTVNEEPEEVYEYETNFALTNGNDASKIFPMQISFNTAENDKNDKDYIYTTLDWGIIDIMGYSAVAEISKNPNYTNPDDSVVKIEQDKITFLKDYTGELNLLMKVKLTNGFDYSVNWKINVNGILTIESQLKYETSYLQNAGADFNSGDEVCLTGPSGTGLGLKLTQSKNNEGDDIISQVNYGSLASQCSYVVVEYDSYRTTSNKELFEGKTATSVTLTSDGTTIKTNLPIVPSTTSSIDKFLVIYKINLTYLDYTTQDYYIAYRVVNNLDISIATETVGETTYRGDNINVDTGLYDNKYLVLFNYAETYKDSAGNEYAVTYKADGYYANDTILDNNTNFNGETITATISGNDVALTKQKNGTIGHYWDGTKVLSVFSLSFVNLSEYKAFIDSIGYVNIGNFYFKLEYISGVGYGIDLTTRYTKFEITNTCPTGFADENKDTTNKLFKNKLEDTDLIIASKEGQPIYTLSHYNENENSGFRLSASTSLVAKGGKKISELFVSSNVTGYTTVKDYVVVGVYSGATFNKTFVTADGSDAGISSETPSDVSGVTISVPTGTGTNLTYTLQTVVYSCTSASNDIYSIEDTFYVIKASSEAIYRMNANKDILVAYKQGNNTVVNLSTMFVKFINSDAGLVVDTGATVSEMTEQSSTGIGGTLSGNLLTIYESKLIEYKNSHPTATYVTVTYSVKFNGQELQCDITFELPEKTTE